MELLIKKLCPQALLPLRATVGSVGWDLSSVRDLVLKPGDRALVPTGLAIALPPNQVGLICPRSGLAFKYGITVLNAPGVIDSDYRGEIRVLLVNLGKEPFVVSRGDRIAQLLVSPVSYVELKRTRLIENTERGDRGFGSTG